MPTKNNHGQPIGRIRKTIEKSDAFTRNVNLQTLADDEDWRRMAMSAQRAATRWRSRFERHQKAEARLRRENRLLRAVVEAARSWRRQAEAGDLDEALDQLDGETPGRWHAAETLDDYWTGDVVLFGDDRRGIVMGKGTTDVDGTPCDYMECLMIDAGAEKRWRTWGERSTPSCTWDDAPVIVGHISGVKAQLEETHGDS